MSKHGKPESFRAKILRFFMPANGVHANPHETYRTGEQPVLDEWGLPYDYDEWSPEDEPDPDPFYNPRETSMDLPVYDPDSPLVRPYLKRAA